MSTREALRTANSAGTLLGTVAATPHDQLDDTADILSALHNAGEIDILTACDKPGLDALPTHSFFGLQRVFCRTLPRLNSPTERAVSACERMFDRAGVDATASSVFAALVQWFQQSPSRVAEGLELVDENTETSSNVVRSVLLGGESHDAAKSTRSALDLSHRASSTIRLPALWVLSRTVPDDDADLLEGVLDRLAAVVTEPLSERDTAAAVDSALHLYRREGERVRDPVESIVTIACRATSPALRQALAYGLSADGASYSENIVDTCVSALQHTQAGEAETVGALDAVLYGWDLDGDSERVVKFLVSLLAQKGSGFDFRSLASFQQKLRDADGDILGWYAISLLLTGRHAVCDVVFGLLPHTGSRAGLDVDLRLFSLSPVRILFLARKILGYCLLKKECAAALLLSCLRVVRSSDQKELEDLVFEHLLMNYPSAIDWMTTNTSTDDPAKGSVDRLATRVRLYTADLEKAGTCVAFAPTETERRLQHYRMGELFRSAHKRAQEDSALLQLIPKANLLYGTGSVIYAQLDPDSKPVRQERPLSTLKHEVEFPRLQELDPVGLQRDLGKFRSEPPPE